MIAFGTKVKDKVTGFEGMVTGKASYMYGCDQYLVNPPVTKEGAWQDNLWLDEGRLQTVALPQLEEKDVQVEKPGGPSRGPKKN